MARAGKAVESDNDDGNDDGERTPEQIAADEDLAKRRARGDYVDEDGEGEGTDPDALAAIVAGEGGKPGKKKGDAAEGEDDDAKADVPYPRFKEVNDKYTTERDLRMRAEGRAEAAEELAKSGQRAPAEKKDDVPEVDIKALRKAERAAMMEGDTDKAAEFGDKADAAIFAKAKKEATAEALHTTASATATEKLNDAAETMIEKYPFLDSNAAEANSKAIAEVIEWRDFYISKGESPARALTKAADRIGAPILKASKDDDEDDEPAAGKKKDERTEQAILRGADAANRQPPRASGGKGDRAGQAGNPDVSKMSDEEFAKLTKAEKARLREDAV